MHATGPSSTTAPQAPEAGPPAMRTPGPLVVAFAPPRPAGGRGRSACGAFARWLSRQARESARAWALAAGVHPDLHD